MTSTPAASAQASGEKKIPKTHRQIRAKSPIDQAMTSVTTRLEWGDGTDHHLARADLTTRIESSAPEETVLELIEEAERHCPVCQLLAGRAELHVLAEVVPA